MASEFQEPQGQLTRWPDELSQYNMAVKHRPSSKHENAYGLFIIPNEQQCSAVITELTCGVCDYCVEAHKTWAGFTELVNATVPLTLN